MALNYTITPFKRWHIDWLLNDGDAEGGFFRPDQETLKAMEGMGTNWTIALDGTPLMCGGTLMQWPGRHIAWAYLNQHTGKHMHYITRRTREYVARAKGRVEITVRADYEKGHRWAKMLGFNEELFLTAFGPQGEDHIGYVMFNKEQV